MVDTVPSHPRRWAILGVICAALMVVVIDVTVLHVAAPAISEDLDPTALQLLWIIDVYPLIAAPLLIASGVLGDRLGGVPPAARLLGHGDLGGLVGTRSRHQGDATGPRGPDREVGTGCPKRGHREQPTSTGSGSSTTP